MTGAATQTVEVSQRVPGSPEIVFRYFTEREKYLSWKGLDAELDPRPGGMYRVDMGGGAAVEGRYLIVEPPHRLVFSWGWRGNPIPPGMAEVPPGSTTVELTFTPEGDETIIRLRHTGLPGDDSETVHRWGWKAFLPRLALVRSGQDPGPHPEVPASAGWIAPPAG